MNNVGGGTLNFDAKSLAKKIGKGALIAGGVTAGLGAAGMAGIKVGGYTMAASPKIIYNKLDRIESELKYLQENNKLSPETSERYINHVDSLKDKIDNMDFVHGNIRNNTQELNSMIKEVTDYEKILFN